MNWNLAGVRHPHSRCKVMILQVVWGTREYSYHQKYQLLHDRLQSRLNLVSVPVTADSLEQVNEPLAAAEMRYLAALFASQIQASGLTALFRCRSQAIVRFFLPGRGSCLPGTPFFSAARSGASKGVQNEATDGERVTFLPPETRSPPPFGGCREGALIRRLRNRHLAEATWSGQAGR